MVSAAYPVVAVVGPTGSGKTQLAMALAEQFQGEIVSCDALQVYRFMNIGTAKAGPEVRERIAHHMLDLRDPDEDFSAGDYQRLARQALRLISAKSRIPLVAGGTGFYLRALIEGLFEGPGRSEEIRGRLRKILHRRGARSLHRALRRVDPDSAAHISPADGSRIVRAYEVYLETGKPMSWWQSQPRDSLQGYRWLRLGIAWPRDILYQRINQRVEEMFQKGFVDEVRGLLERFPPGCHAFQAIGYRQIVGYLQGKWSLEHAIGDTQQESRHYAKRQLTWFRADKEVNWLDVSPDWESCVSRASALVAAFTGR